MSRRQLKKLSGYDETAELAKAMGLADEDIPSMNSKKSQPKKAKKGGFASFLDLDEDNEVDEEEEEVEEILEEKPIEVKRTPKKKKNQKKNKKKQNNEAKPKTDESFDDILDAYGFKNSGPAPTEDTSENFSKSKSVLQIESKFLDPDQELKRIFGSAAVNEAQNGNRNRNPHRNRPVRSGTIIRNAVPGRMPAGRGGLSMSEDEKRQNGDIMWWRFTHNKDYQETQSEFLSAIKVGSHELLMQILARAPSHCDSLLSLSDACRMQDDTQASKELLERLLYVMETSLHPRCIIGNGKNRFDYKRPENRPFFGGLFRYCQLSAKRGCWRTALEQAKLLLSFDPTDPLAVVLLIPLFAVRAGKFAELLEMETELDYRDVKSLPNWSLNIALSLIHLNEIDLAKEKLVKCLSDHPGLLFPLLEKMQAEPCPELVSSEHFQTDEGLAKKTLYKLICTRETELWKSDSNAQALLQSSAEEVLKFHFEKKNINSKKIPPQITRHAILCDIPIPDLKPDESQFHDPLPPENPILDYEPKANETGNSFGHINSVSQHFLASFLPGMEQGGQEEGGIDIQNQVRNLVASMSDLLDQIRTVPDVPQVPENHELDQEDEFD